jgi:hypothetical protein
MGRVVSDPPAAGAWPPARAMRPQGQNERRSDPRSWGRSLSARIRGGHDVMVINLSASGALIEGSRPLRPGARVEVYLAGDPPDAVLPARVARCLVAAIDAEHGITYHAALSFERRFEWWCEGDTLAVSSMHDVCSSSHQ